MSDQIEHSLKGGRTTQGVVRVSDTVRRPPSPNSEFVSRLLRHLEANNFNGAPVSLGMDEQGRDIFSFIEGDVPSDLAIHPDQTLVHAARLIRNFHDLAAYLVDSPAALRVGIETVCHNDLSPCNFVFRSGIPVAIIDFDAAAPGSRNDDLGYAIWLWLDLGSPDIAAEEQARRLRLFLDAYGGRNPASVVQRTLTRQARAVARARSLGDHAMAGWAERCAAWTLERQRTLIRLHKP